MTKRDYYEVLGVSKSSTQKEIKSAFKKLAKTHHPDVSKEENSEEKFKEVQEAYAILSDEQKRAQYDQYGHDAFDQMQGHGYEGFDFSDIFSEIFGGRGGFSGFGSQRRQDPNAPRKGRDAEMNISLTFKEAVFGCKKDINITQEVSCSNCNGSGGESGSDVVSCKTCNGQGRVMRQQQSIFGMSMSESLCNSCNGSGKTIKNRCKKCHGAGREEAIKTITINIPAGVDNNAYMRVPQKGEGGFNGGPAGDLFLNIFIQEDDFFKRSGNDIYVEIPISYTQASLGATIQVPTIHGDVNLKIPAGSQTGTKLRIRSKGIHAKTSGDQIVIINISVPRNLSSKEKKLLKELSEIEGIQSEQKGFFENIKRIFK